MPPDPSVVTGYTTTLCYLLPFLPLPVTLTAPARLYILAVIQVQYNTFLVKLENIFEQIAGKYRGNPMAPSM